MKTMLKMEVAENPVIPMLVLSETVMISDPSGKDYEQGVADGKHAEHDQFWEKYFWNVKKDGVGANLFAGRGWNEHTRLPYRIDFVKNGYNMFSYSGNIPKEEIAKIDFTKMTSNFPNFNESLVQHIPEIDTRSTSGLTMLFYRCTKLVSIDNIILKDDGSQTLSNLFQSCSSLEEVRFSGVIGKNGLNFVQSSKLSHNSLMSIINALQDKSEDTSGTSWVVTFGSINTAKLTDAEKAIATQKGWTLA